MNTKAVVAAIVGTQLILGLILILILISVGNQGKTSVYPCYQADGKGGYAYSPTCVDPYR